MEASRASPLTGLDVLVVEDETMVAFLAEDMLRDLGCTVVWHAISVRRALELLAERVPGAAVLDVNLGVGTVYPVAELLLAKQVPFVFATGYGRVPQPWSAHPVIAKPFKIEELEAALLTALRTRSQWV